MTRTMTRFGALSGVVGIVLSFAMTLNADPPRGSATPSAKTEDADKAEVGRVPLAVAKDRAKLMHDIYSSTLDAMHHHYFRRDGAVLPARALEDVFAELNRQSNVKTRWIAVNTPAMSLGHEPESAFEKKAANELASGKADFERVEKGYYYRAGAIPLGSGCVSCHSRFAATGEKKGRVAGLVIAIPIKD